MTFIEFTTDPGDSPGDLAGKTQSGSHAKEETEEAGVGKTQGRYHAEEEDTEEGAAATDSGSSPDARAEGDRHAPDEAQDDERESPNDRMSYLAGDVPKYDDSDDEKDERDYMVKGNDTDKKGKGGDRVAFDPERADRNSLIFLSLLLMVAMAAVVWRSFHQPLILVWRLSFLLCCCCTIWAGLLATTLPAQTVLRYLIFVFVVALYIDAALNPKIGMLVAHLNSHLAAGILGYALAERSQEDGTEVSAATASAFIPFDEKHADRLHCAQIVGGVYFGMITVGVTAGVVWVVCHSADFSAECLVMCISLALCGVLVPWITYVGTMLLRGALIGEIGFSALIMYLTMVTLIYVFCAVTIGEVWAMLVAWPLVLGFSGIFGYCMCVYSSFKLRMKLGLQLMNPYENKELSLENMFLEKKDRGNGDLHPGNKNVISSSYSVSKRKLV